LPTVPETFRQSVEQASLPLIRAISGRPRWLVFLATLALMLAGVLVPGWGWVFFLLVAVFLAWILYLSWPRLTPVERLMRSAVLVLIGAVTVVRAFPQG
jgi:hypothetical protein